MRHEHNKNYNAAQTWIVHLKMDGESLLEKLIGPSDLKRGIYRVTLEHDDNRKSIKQLMNEVRHLGALKIAQKCRKDGIKVSDSKILQLADDRYMEGSLEEA
jgi:formamidopyrimidine-DNA glycosylase